MSINTELLKGSVTSLVLTMLHRKDMYGYELIKELHLRSNGLFDLKEGTLYPILHSLELARAVEAYWEESPGGRSRKYYHITKSGKVLLREKRKEWFEFERALTGILGAEQCLIS